MTVTNSDIYYTAVGMLGLEATDPTVPDYEERAPYLIASFCCMVRELDKRIRRREHLTNQTAFSPVYLALESDFPLCEQLSSSASLYLAAMLVIEENQALSDSLYAKYADSISSLTGDFTETEVISDGYDSYSVCESIVNRYFFD